MREGSLDAPVRHPLDWQAPDFDDPQAIDAELRRVFDICHGCRRCFNLCDSFPRLFDLIDEAPSMELDTVASADFKPVVDACTLCDMCFMTKCPYVPPHPFELDFPHLMLRYRAAEFRRGERRFEERQITATDRNGRLAGMAAPLANWAADTANRPVRGLIEGLAGVHREAALPRFHHESLEHRALAGGPAPNPEAPAFGRRAVLYATCYGNYNSPETGIAARAVLAHNGVDVRIAHPGCCGMPQLEQGDIEGVAARARRVGAELLALAEQGFDIVALMPSCALMLKFEWPLLLPDDEDIARLARSVFDASEYVVDIARREGLARGLAPLDGPVAVHLACHSRAQNMGRKAAEMLELLPDTKVEVIERCSGHGGSWGCMKDNFETAMKVGRPTARRALEAGGHVVSECPLAGLHIAQGMERLGGGPVAPVRHPVELLARAYGFDENGDLAR